MVRSVRAAAIFAALATAGALAAAACSDAYSSAPDATDSGVDASDPEGGAHGGSTDPCLHETPPPTSTADDPGTSLPAFTVAFTGLAPEGGAPTGFDLDGVCTCDTRAGTAHDGGESCARPKGVSTTCDGDGGVDDNLGTLFDTFGTFYPLASVVSEQIAKGRANVLMQIADYNGAANDHEITVALLTSQGLRVQGCPGSVLDPNYDTYSPGWCGDDAWTFTSESVVGGVVKAPVVVGAGYVKDWTLVARVKGAPRVPFTDEYAVSLIDPIVVGKLVPLDETLQPRDPSRAPTGREPRLWRIEDGRVGGRIPGREIILGIGVTKVAADGGNVQLCTQASFGAVKSILCTSPDVTAQSGMDFDPAAACDAVSAGVPFVAAPVLVGNLFDRTRRPGPCDPGPGGNPLDAGAVTYTCP